MFFENFPKYGKNELGTTKVQLFPYSIFTTFLKFPDWNTKTQLFPYFFFSLLLVFLTTFFVFVFFLQTS